MTGPDPSGRFGDYGGRYVPEALIAALDELTAAYEKALGDEGFQQEFHRLLHDYAGRPSLLYDAERFSQLYQLAPSSAIEAPASSSNART